MTSQRILLADATSKTTAYRGLSRNAAEAGNLWLAVHAQAASDAAFTRSFCIQTGVPHIDLANAAVYLDTDEEADSSQEAAEVFRGALAMAMPDWAADRWAASLPSLDHLPADSPVEASVFRQTIMDRFAGDDPHTYLLRREEDRRAAVEDYHGAMSDNQPWNAVAAAYAADTAAFEMWLLQRSLSLADPHLTQYEMLWRLASHSIDQITQLPDDPGEAMFLLRVRLTWVVGPQEAAALRPVFHEIGDAATNAHQDDALVDETLESEPRDT